MVTDRGDWREETGADRGDGDVVVRTLRMASRSGVTVPARPSSAVADPARLAALRQLGLLDTAREEAFDRLTYLAATALDVPMAAVSLVDEDRQFYKSSIGMGRDVDAARETPLEASLCRHVVELRQPLVIEDTRLEPLTEGTSLIARGMLAYAGMPLTTSAGYVLGTLCAMDEAPHKWSVRALDVLAALSASVMGEIELHSARMRERNGARLDELVGGRTASLEGANRSLVAAGASLELSRKETIWRLAGAIKSHSGETSAHSRRMSIICSFLAERIGLDASRAELIGVAGALHDVGKLAVPDMILNKPGPLSATERTVMETHTEIGQRMLSGSGEPLLELAAVMALTHHEWVDGSGYPGGLADGQIPIESRIAAVADVFDALINHRVYRPAFATAEVMRIMDAGRGTQFDPIVFDALRDGLDQVLAAAQEAAR